MPTICLSSMGTRDMLCRSQMVDLVGHARHLDGVALVDAVSFSSPQYRGNGAPREIESHRSWRQRSSTPDMGSVMTDNNNHLFARNPVAQPFQQAIMDGDALIWNQAFAHLYMHGNFSIFHSLTLLPIWVLFIFHETLLLLGNSVSYYNVLLT